MKKIEPAQSNIAINLKSLCTAETSVSVLCRKIEINRQQFARYLSGENHPSPHNQLKIERYFGIETGALHMPKQDFEDRYGSTKEHTGSAKNHIGRLVGQTFDTDLRRLRPYLGYYHSYFYSFGWQGMIMKTLVCLYEHEGQVLSKSIERLRDPVTGHRFVFKYSGIVTMKAERLFIAETSTLSAGEMAMTILYSTYRSQATKLSGLTMGSSSASRREPTVARVIYSKIGTNVDMKKALRTCGLLLPSSLEIPADIKPLLKNTLSQGNDVLTALPVE